MTPNLKLEFKDRDSPKLLWGRDRNLENGRGQCE